MAELSKVTAQRTFCEPFTITLDNLEAVRDRIQNLLKEKLYSIELDDTRHERQITHSNCRLHDKLFAFMLDSWTSEEPTDGVIQFNDSWGGYNIKTGDRISFAKDSFILEGANDEGDTYRWKFTLED